MSNKLMGTLGGTMLAAALLLGAFGAAVAQRAGSRGSDWGPGGMMGGGSGGNWGMGGMMGGWGAATPAGLQAISLDDAKQAVENYLSRYGDPNLKIDEIMEFQNNFYAVVQEKDTGKGAMELLVNKVNGEVFPEYGPNMMWNTKYGPMSGFGGGMMGGGWRASSQNQETVTADQARSIAQQWLDTNQTGSTTETPDAFYGYYTLHILKDGKITGMLSVNGYSGQLWYHTWHGNFVAMEEGVYGIGGQG